MTSTWRTLAASLSAGALLLTVFGCSSVDSTSSPSAQPSTTSSPSVTTTPEPSQTAEEQQSTTDMIGQAPEGAQDNALTVLNTLEVKGRAPKTGYSRDQFGAAWADVDRNGCDTRNDILNRDLTGKTYKANTHDCVVASGVLQDPYTGTRIDFVRGQDTSTAVQIDHVVALSDAWQKGAQQLTEDERRSLANDPYNLLAVDGPSNQRKSDGDAATWLPANTGFRCEYVARQIGVKQKYRLWVTQAEHDAMANVLATCPAQTIPTDGGVATTVQPEQQPAQTVEPQPTQEAPEPQPTQEAQPAPQPVQQDTTVYYKNCAAVRAAGKAPLHQGEPGYSSKLDRDGDGIACE
ncbi:calcium-binding protein [Bifidobacterium pseudolongum subsp. globosum]|uniref:Calcium-binding protein n=2 Tax=Bifidobacterium pseudolongum TaxID=1694 RepID=A0A4Q5A437_9BIFI|nr:calcium-binding protein [Bifidobacterium pseudolongum subsp. globosum]